MYKFDTGTTWSECNRKDFAALYQQNKDIWCMGDVTAGKFNVYFFKIKSTYIYTLNIGAGSCAIDFQTESVLSLNEKLKVNWKFYLFFIFRQILSV